MANPDLSALAAYGGEYKQQLFSKFYRGLTAAKDLTLVENVKNKLNLTGLDIDGELKPGTGIFKPKGGFNFKPRVLQVEEFQRDVQMFPKKFRTSFMAAMRGRGEGAKNKNIPFAQYCWEQFMLQNASQINKRTIYFGVGKGAYADYDAGAAYAVGDRINIANPTDGEIEYWQCKTITTAAQTPYTHPAKWKKAGPEAICEGFGPKIAAGVSSGEIGTVTTGAITTSSGAYAQFKKVWRAQDEEIRDGDALVPTFCSYTDYDLLTDDQEDKVSKYTEIDQSTNMRFLKGTERRNVIIPVLWLGGAAG